MRQSHSLRQNGERSREGRPTLAGLVSAPLEDTRRGRPGGARSDARGAGGDVEGEGRAALTRRAGVVRGLGRQVRALAVADGEGLGAVGQLVDAPLVAARDRELGLARGVLARRVRVPLVTLAV